MEKCFWNGLHNNKKETADNRSSATLETKRIGLKQSETKKESASGKSVNIYLFCFESIDDNVPNRV